MAYIRLMALVLVSGLWATGCSKDEGQAKKKSSKKAVTGASGATSGTGTGSGSASGSGTGSGTGSGSAVVAVPAAPVPEPAVELPPVPAPGKFLIDDAPTDVAGLIKFTVKWASSKNAATYDVSLADNEECTDAVVVALDVPQVADAQQMTVELPPQEAGERRLCIFAKNVTGSTPALTNGKFIINFSGNQAPTAGVIEILEAPSPFIGGNPYKARVKVTDFADLEGDPVELKLGANACDLTAAFDVDSGEYWLTHTAMGHESCDLELTLGDGKVDCPVDVCEKKTQHLAAIGVVKEINKVANRGGMLRGAEKIVSLSATKIIFPVYTPAAGLELWVSTGANDNGVLLKDIAPGSASGFAGGEIVVMGTNAFFSGYTYENGFELWKTDGTAAGTVLVNDIQGGEPSSHPRDLFADGATLYFTARDKLNGREIWKSNGDAGNATLVKDVNAGPDDGVQGAAFFAKVDNAANSGVIFRGCDAAEGCEIWKIASDGSTAAALKNLVPTSRLGGNPGAAGSLGAAAYFSVQSGPSIGLNKTDGTNGGTAVHLASALNARDFIKVGTKLYFLAQEAGSPLWKVFRTDGTAAAKLMVAGVPNAQGLMAGDDEIYFWVGAVGGAELWRWDNAANATTAEKIGDFARIPYDFLGSSALDGSTMYFAADGLDKGVELWRVASDKTLTNFDVNGGGDGGPAGMLNVDGVIYFGADDGSTGRELRKIVANDKALVVDAGKGPGDTFPANHSGVAEMVLSQADNKKMYFTAEDEARGRELWSTIGTGASTQIVADVRTGPSSGVLTGSVYETVALSKTLTVFGADGIHEGEGGEGAEVWSTDNTFENTVRIVEQTTGAVGSNPRSFRRVRNKAYFCSDHGLFRTDGTTLSPVPTTLLKFVDCDKVQMTVAGDVLYFVAEHTTLGTIVFSLSEAGDPSAVPAPVPLSVDTTGKEDLPHFLAAVGSAMYFTAQMTGLGYELWRSDAGASVKTPTMGDLNPTSHGSNPENLFAVGNKLFFSAYTATAGRELWISDDGTPTGTRQVKNIAGSSASSEPRPIGAIGAKLIFFAKAASGPFRLYKSDGTDGGTVPIDATKSFKTNTMSFKDPRAVATLQGAALHFVADDGVSGQELWTTDGNATVEILIDLTPEAGASSRIWNPIVMDDVLYFQAAAPDQGLQLWRFSP